MVPVLFLTLKFPVSLLRETILPEGNFYVFRDQSHWHKIEETIPVE
jgi:hypothetical protein